MVRVCPNPIPWNEIFKQLSKHAEAHRCNPPAPPRPLILAGWAFSSDIEKKRRWEETVAWANSNGCSEIVSGVADADFVLVNAEET